MSVYEFYNPFEKKSTTSQNTSVQNCNHCDNKKQHCEKDKQDKNCCIPCLPTFCPPFPPHFCNPVNDDRKENCQPNKCQPCQPNCQPHCPPDWQPYVCVPYQYFSYYNCCPPPNPNCCDFPQNCNQGDFKYCFIYFNNHNC